MSTQGSTAERILDAAESLFSEHGYDGVSVRAITDLAGVRLNLLSYHFGTKEGLFEAVIDRRLDVLNHRRQLALADLDAITSNPSIEQLLIAFIRPYFALAVSGTPGWTSYTLLISQVVQSRRHSPLLEAHMRGMMDIFIDRFALAMPDVDRAVLERAFLFTIALMVSAFSGAGRIGALVENTLDDEALDAAYRPLLTYCVAGFLALCGKSDKPA